MALTSAADTDPMRRASAGRRLAIFGGACAAGALVVGVFAAGAAEPHAHATAAPTTTSTTTAAPGSCTAPFTGTRAQRSSARTAWATKYGYDRTAMADEPDVDAASPFEQAAATDLLTRTRDATSKYADLDVARRAGYDIDAALARARKRQGLDDGAMPRMVHVLNMAARCDGTTLDPDAPETLMYMRHDDSWQLVGVMYVATEAAPAAPPSPGGPITRWHYHPLPNGTTTGLMMHVFFTDDLATAYAVEMSGHH
jgi:hypothetical protein